MKYTQKITPQQHFFDFDLTEFWHRRYLLWVLVKRDLQVRYKNTILGVAWVILQPLLATLIFTLLFTRIFHFDQSQDNYLVYTLSGFILWQFFSASVATAASSVYEQISIIKKVYFPRLFLPLTVVLRCLFDLFINTVFLGIILWWQNMAWSWSGAVGYVLGVGVLAVLATGLSFLFSSLNAIYRDFRHLIPFIIQIWFYCTPVFYATSLLSDKLSWLIWLNPVTQILLLVRQAIFSHSIGWGKLGILYLISFAILIYGMGTFKKMESQVIDQA
jgi:lipopolysaccharide transport system permease protein